MIHSLAHALSYAATSALNTLWPAQPAVRNALHRDFNHYLDDVEARALRFLTNGAAGSVCVGPNQYLGADLLAEYEAEHEVHEPAQETSLPGAGSAGVGPAGVSDGVSPAPSAGRAAVDLPWNLEVLGDDVLITNCWGVVIAHFDSPQDASAVIDAVHGRSA